MPDGAPSHDQIARQLICTWLDSYGPLFTPGALASVLLTISRVAADMAEEQIAKLPDLPEDDDEP